MTTKRNKGRSNAKLKKRLAKEAKRPQDSNKFKQEDDKLGNSLLALRNERNFPYECC